MIESIILALVSAVAYSVVFYVKKNKPDDPEDFEPFNFGATVLVGLGVGVMYVYSGTEITQQGIETQLIIYGGTVMMVESILKAVYRRVVEPRL